MTKHIPYSDLRNLDASDYPVRRTAKFLRSGQPPNECVWCKRGVEAKGDTCNLTCYRQICTALSNGMWLHTDEQVNDMLSLSWYQSQL